MSNRVILYLEKEAPIISITLIGTHRIEWGITLNDPNSHGSRLGHWTGDNTNQEKVEYPPLVERGELPTSRWAFAGLGWLFITRPNPGVQERYEIHLRIEQGGTETYSKLYHGEPLNPAQDEDHVIFMPND